MTLTAKRALRRCDSLTVAPGTVLTVLGQCGHRFQVYIHGYVFWVRDDEVLMP